MAKRKMSFDEYQRKVLVKTVGARKYYEHVYQMNHIGGNPENCCLDHLELGSVDDNKDAYSTDARLLYRTVFKRPARKRGADAM